MWLSIANQLYDHAPAGLQFIGIVSYSTRKESSARCLYIRSSILYASPRKVSIGKRPPKGTLKKSHSDMMSDMRAVDLNISQSRKTFSCKLDTRNAAIMVSCRPFFAGLDANIPDETQQRYKYYPTEYSVGASCSTTIHLQGLNPYKVNPYKVSTR